MTTRSVGKAYAALVAAGELKPDADQARAVQALDRFAGKAGASAGTNLQGKAEAQGFPAEFEALKVSVIRPAFERIGSRLKARGHAFNVSEEGTKISLHIVPAGVSKSIHPYDWFPTFTFFAAPFTKSIGTQVRNTRPIPTAVPGRVAITRRRSSRRR